MILSRLALCLCAAVVALAAPAAAQDGISFTDMAGRAVTLKRPATRIVLAEANDLLSIALVDPNPADRVVGWAALRRFDNGTLDLYRRKFPQIDKVAVVGDWTADTFSVEKAVSLRPDLVLMTAFQDPKLGKGEFARQFEAAGIPIAFITSGADTRAAATDIAPRLRMLGKILGQEQRAEDYIAFYAAELERVTSRIATLGAPRPKVLIETYAGLAECCRAPGRHGWAEFVELAGGRNLTASVPAQAGGMLSMEYLLAQAPDIYVGNGGSYLQGKGLTIGPGYSEADIRAALASLAARPGFRDLKAVKDKRVYGIWTVFATQPTNLLVIQRLAKWFHPALFADLDPDRTLDDINRRFSAVPMAGHYWLALDETGNAK